MRNAALFSTLGLALTLGACSSPANETKTIVFEEPREYDFPADLYFGDINGDGNLDAVAHGVFDDVSFGHSGGVFRGYQRVEGLEGRIQDVADVNGDGRADVIVEEGSRLRILYGQPDGSLLRAADLLRGDFMLATDVDGDGQPEVVTFQDSAYYAATVDSVGHFLAIKKLADAVTHSLVAAGDLNGDGKVDFFDNIGDLFLSGPDGYRRSSLDIGALEVKKLVSGDVNRDGKIDLVAFCKDSGRDHWAVLIMNGAGDGNFFMTREPMVLDEQPNINTSKPGDIRLFDINGDGALDLAFVVSSGVRFHAGDGDGGFAPQGLELQNYSVKSMHFFDVNHDGKPDLLTQTSGGEVRVFTQL